MVLSLTPELRRYVEEKVQSGQYASADALVIEAVRHLKNYEERLASLRRDIQLGIDQLDRGEGEPWDMEETKRRVTERLRRDGKLPNG
jgi:antitoxin ParD1/3/4